MPIIYKSIESAVENIDKKLGIVRHYWSAFENLDADADIITHGSFARTISERGPQGSNRIKFLWQHDPWEPIGVPLKLTEDGHGLLATTKVAPTRRGLDALILYEEGVLTEHSIGLDVKRRDEKDQRRILDIELWEGSVVTWGANPNTPVVDLKALSPAEATKRLRHYVSNIRKALDAPLSDETAESLALTIPLLEAEILAIEKAVTTPTLRSADVETKAEPAWDSLLGALDSLNKMLLP